MIVAFSCSSPVSSIALISEEGEVLFSQKAETMRNASGLTLEMLKSGLQTAGLSLKDASLFVADVGPGSFIGSRVSVTLAKTFGFAEKRPVGGVISFDLIDPSSAVALPSKKGEYFLRRPGCAPFRTTNLPEEPLVGYGVDFAEQTYPDAARAASLLWKVKQMKPELLLPEYLIEPSISTPKAPYGRGSGQVR